jgi:hypothetical protein
MWPDSSPSTACSGNAARIVATIAFSASVSAAAAMSACSFACAGSRFKSRAASMTTDPARRAARTATARTGSLIIERSAPWPFYCAGAHAAGTKAGKRAPAAIGVGLARRTGEGIGTIRR